MDFLFILSHYLRSWLEHYMFEFSINSFHYELSNYEIKKKTEVMCDIANNWKELSGETNWEGLLDPLDSNLCNYIIHYGERVQAVYDAFDKDTPHGFPPCVPKNLEFPPCAPKNLFSNVGLEKGNPYKYTLTNYLYALSDVISPLDWVVKDRSAWIGYVAVATDEGKAALGRRDILISWRGTVLAAEWFKDFDFDQISASDIFEGTTENCNPMVHGGFHSLYTSSNVDCKYSTLSARQQVLEAVRKLVDEYKDEELSITITGHSLGSALATLNAADIVANGYNKPTGPNDVACMVTAIVFASPKVGNPDFKTIFQGLDNLHLLHIRNQHDIIPKFPLALFVKLGKELRIDATKSTYLKIPFSLLKRYIISHNLEVYLHGVATTQEIIHRDISLVNKSLDVLKDEYNVPPKWWNPEKNFEGMVQQDDGTWKQGLVE